MADAVIVALITGGCSILGVVLTNIASNKKIETQLITAQAVTDEKIEQLTDEVRRHNSFGDRITTAEAKIQELMARLERLDGKIEHLREHHEAK
jgi:predicted  nucleic acid-binding Zn-ribbon protein